MEVNIYSYIDDFNQHSFTLAPVDVLNMFYLAQSVVVDRPYYLISLFN